MKRIIIYCLILGLILLIPVERLDVGDLEPVQAVWVHREQGNILLETDTEGRGRGATLQEALSDLENNCLKIIYLDTAQFLLVSEQTQSQIPELKELLKGSVKVCLWDGNGSVADAAQYLSAHEIGIKIRLWKPEVKLPNLQLENKAK